MNPRKKLAQSAVEFLIFMGVVFAAVLAVIVVSYSHMTTLQNEKHYRMVREQAFVLQNELVLAAMVEDGYHRSVDVAQKLEYSDYTIEMLNNSLFISTQKSSYMVRIPFVNGTFSKGVTNISKENGTVYLR